MLPLKESLSVPLVHRFYDETYGDAKSQIPVWTSIKDLAEDYCCSFCGDPKAGFEEMKLQIL